MSNIRSQIVHKLALAETVVTFYDQTDRDRVNVVLSVNGRKQPYEAMTREEARKAYRVLLDKGYVDPSKPAPAPVAAKPKRVRKPRKATPAEAAAL